MFCAKYFLKQIKKTVGFRSVLKQYDNTIVYFWYLPPSIRNQKETPDWWERMYAVTVEIKRHSILEGSLIIIYASLPQLKLVAKSQSAPTRNAEMNSTHNWHA